jgi:PAS domain S-box-containing protein
MERPRPEDERPEAGIFVDHASVVHDAGDLTRKSREMLKRYGLALALAGLALFLRGVLPFREGTAIYQLPLAAVVLSAWYGGRGPGLLASLICITGVGYWFVPPVNSFAIAPDHVLPFSIFIGLCLLLSEFSAGRRRTEHARRASEERFRALVQFSFDVYWETDAQHRFTRQEFSDRVTDALATSSVIGKTRWDIPYLEPDEEAWRRHRATLDAHLPFRDFEHARPTPDGGKRHVSVSGMPVFDEFGRFVGYRGVGRHITDRKLAEAERRAHVWFLASMDRVNRAMQGTNDVAQMMGDVLEAVLDIFASDRAWLIYPCDPDAPSWRPIMERTRPEFPGAVARSHDLPVTPESAELARVALASSGALPRGGSHKHQPGGEIAEHFGVRSDMLMALRPQGDRPYLFGLHQCSRVRTWTKEEQRLFEEVGHRLTDALGSLIAFRGLRESEARLEAAQRLARVGWWERDYATGHVSLSDEACRILGVQPLERPQWHGDWLSLIHPEDRENAAAVSDLALRGGPRYDVEYRVVRPDGAVRVVHSQGDVTREESGRPVRQFGVMQDITELRKAEEALRESEQRYRTLFEKANDAVFLENDRDDIVDANERACTLLGYSRDELLKMKLPDLQAPEVRGQVGRVVRERIEKHGSATFETVDLHRTGRRIPVEVTISEIRHRGENLVLSVVRDITERKRAEDALRAAQSEVTHLARVMTMGELTASIAHEINQPIAAAITDASTCVRWLSRTEPDLDEARQAAQRAVQDATRAADIITRIRRLFKGSGLDAEPVNVNDVVEELITLLRREAQQFGVSITAALAPDLPLVMGDRVQLQQVLLNLLMNGLEATKGVGDRREITVTSRRADGDQVHVAVTDTGVGLPPTGADELFKAFFTTKAGGTGMGLAISRSIIEAHGGRLWAASNADRGATFTFTLPIARDAPA